MSKSEEARANELEVLKNHNSDSKKEKNDGVAPLLNAERFRRLPFWPYLIGAAIVWTCILAASLYWDVSLIYDQTQQLIHREAVSNFNKDQGFRDWGTSHGGVYVPITEKTPPSPYMAHIPERDIQTPSGKKLTLLNPAYMVRQLMDDYAPQYGIKGKITGLILLRSENAPDDWERQALLKLKAGAKEVVGNSKINGELHHRLMRPMYMKPGCDKCHGHLGFKTGDFRGGVGVSVPVAPFMAAENTAAKNIATTHFAIWVVGLCGMGFGGRQFRNNMRARYEVEQSLHVVESRFSEILRIAPEAIISTDSDGRILMFNDSSEKTFGYKRDEMIGQPLDVLLPEYVRPKHRSYMKGFIDGQETTRLLGSRGEVSGRRHDGTIFPAEASVSKLQLDNQLILTVTMRDITDRKQAEEELRMALADAERANQSKSEFLATMSHELRTPLNAIIGFSETMSGQYFGALGSTKYVEYACDIKNSGEHLLKLINDLLDLSTIEAGKLSLHKEPIHFAEVVKEIAPIVIELANLKNINYINKTSDDLPPIQADRRALIQIMINILSNAVKFTPENGEISLTTTASNNALTVEVRDTGVGIPKNKIENLTDPFMRGEPDPHKAQEGTGLGLAIVKSLVDLHDGDLVIESEVDVGTTVTIRLPFEAT